MTRPDAGQRPAVRRALDSWRRLTTPRRQAPPLPWARPRPQFGVPEAKEGPEGLEGADQQFPEAAQQLDAEARPDLAPSGQQSAALPRTAGGGSVADSRGRTVLEHPVYFGFMATVGVGLALLVYYLAVNVGAVAGWVTGALFIALGLDPLVRWLESRGVPRRLGVTGILVVLAGIIAFLSAVVVPALAQQAVDFINRFPTSFNDFLSSDFMRGVDEQTGIRSVVDRDASEMVRKAVSDSSVVGGFLNNLVQAGSTLAQFVTGTLIVSFLAVYFLASLPMIKAWGVRLAPRSRRARVAELSEKITDSVGHYVMGQAVVALLNACFALVLMTVLHLPFPLLVTLFVAMLAFVPLVGGVCAGILVTLLALLQGWQTAALYAVCYFAYLQIEAYVISPRIMKKAVAVPGAVAVIAVAAGGAIWGVLGALIAIPVAASGLLMVREVLVPHQDRR